MIGLGTVNLNFKVNYYIIISTIIMRLSQFYASFRDH